MARRAQVSARSKSRTVAIAKDLHQLGHLPAVGSAGISRQGSVWGILQLLAEIGAFGDFGAFGRRATCAFGEDRVSS